MIALTGCWPFGSVKQESKKTAELFVINVLEQDDYDDCHIKGSIHVDFDEFENKMKSWDKQDYYVVYCADYLCMSSAYCVKLLQDAGFKNVWAYEGGMAEWYQKGYPYEGPAELEYLKGENLNLADDEDSHVSVVTAEQLFGQMKDFGLLA
jgi:rhodanese-related sulfurtransferase